MGKLEGRTQRAFRTRDEPATPLSYQKYLNPGYIAYSGAEAIAGQGLAVHTAGSFDRSFTTVGSIVHSLQAEMEAAQVLRWAALAEFYAESTAASYDAKLVDHGYIATSGMEAIAAQARAVRNASMFDGNYMTAGSIVHSLQAELEAAQEVRWAEMAAFYADRGLLTIDPDAATAYCWNAMARFYADNDLLNEKLEVAVESNANR